MSDFVVTLQDAITCYRKLRDHLAEVETAWSADGPATVEAFLQRLNRLQEAVRSADERLVAALGKAPAESEQPLRDELTALMAESVDRSLAAIPRLRALQGLVSCELRQLREHRGALAGYRPGEDRKGKVVRSTF